MSSIIFQDVNTIEYSSLKFDYLAINTDDILDQFNDERLLVNQLDSKFSMIVLDNGLHLNSTREQAQQNKLKNYTLYVQGGNAYFDGSITAKSITLSEVDFSESNVDKLLKVIDDKILQDGPFYPVQDPLYLDYKNYYTHKNINILTQSDSSYARCNLNALNINRSAEYSIQNAQLAIRNNIDDNADNLSEMLFGILGNDYKSPAMITTNPGKSLEFYISKDNKDLNSLYQYNIPLPNNENLIPTLKIDTSNCVNINSLNAKELSYNVMQNCNIVDKTKLNVDGLAYIQDLVVYDYVTDTPKHLNDIYIQHGTTDFYPHNIYPGTFNGEFTFSSNITIDNSLKTNKSYTDYLKSTNAHIDGLNTHNISTVNVDFSGRLNQDGKPLNVTNIDVCNIYYSYDTIKNNLIAEYFYKESDIIENLSNILIFEGIKTNFDNVYGIRDLTISHITTNISNILNLNLSTRFYTDDDVLSVIKNTFTDEGSMATIDYINNWNIIDTIDSNKFHDLSNLLRDTTFIILNTVNDVLPTIKATLYDNGNSNITSIKNTDSLTLEYDNLSNILYDVEVLDTDLFTTLSDDNISSNIIFQINNSGFCNIYDRQYYDTEEYLSNVFSNIIDHRESINISYNNYISNIVIDNLYTFSDIIDKLSNNGINDTIRYVSNLESYNILNTIADNLNLVILADDHIFNDYCNIILSEGVNALTYSNIVKEFNVIKTNLTTFTNYNLYDYNNLYIRENLASNLYKYIHQNGIKDLYNQLYNFSYNISNDTKANITNHLLINFIANYDTNLINNKTLLTYKVKDFININGGDVEFEGKVGIGGVTDGSMLSIKRKQHNNKTVPEIYLNDFYDNDMEYKTFIGHNDTKTFKIETNSEYSDHHIVLNAGKSKNNLPSMFLKCNSTNVGINTDNPIKTLHINGDILVEDNYYTKYLDKTYKLLHFVADENNNGVILNNTFNEIRFSKVNIDTLKVNTLQDKDNKELFSFQKKISSTGQPYLYSDIGCLFIGQDVSTRIKQRSFENTAMLLQNTSKVTNNNSILRIYKANKAYGNGYNIYSGIEITKFASKPYTGWFLHNYHETYDDDGYTEVEQFNIGFKNNYDEKFNIIKSEYVDRAIKIEIGDGSDHPIIFKNNIVIEGDIDVQGIYKLNGVEFSSNNILLSTIVNGSPDPNSIVQDSDMLFASSKRLFHLVERYSSIFMGNYVDANRNFNEIRPDDDDYNLGFTQYVKRYTEQHYNKLIMTSTDKEFDAKLNLINSRLITTINSDNVPPMFAVKGVYDGSGFSQNRENKTTRCSMRLALLDVNGIDYWNNNNYVDFNYNLYHNKSRFSIDLKYNGLEKIKPFEIYTSGQSVYTKFSSSESDVKDNTFFHIYDNFKDELLCLETDSKPVKISLENNKYKWNIQADDTFKIFNNNSSILLGNNGIGIFNENPKATLDIANNNQLVAVNISNNYNGFSGTDCNLSLNVNKIQDVVVSTTDRSFTVNIDTLVDIANIDLLRITPKVINLESSYTFTKEITSNLTGTDFIQDTINRDDIKYSNLFNFNLTSNLGVIDLDINFNDTMWNNLLSNAFNANSVNLQLVNSSNHTFTNFNVNVSQLSNYDIDVISNVNQYDVYIIEGGELIYSSDIGGYTINVYHPNVFNYFNYDIAIDLDVDYTFKANVISGLESNMSITLENVGYSRYNISYLDGSVVNIHKKNKYINLTKQVSLDNKTYVFDLNDFQIYYDTIDYEITRDVDIDVIINDIKYHIKLENTIYDSCFYLNGLNQNFEIIYTDKYTYKSALNLDAKGTLSVDKLNVKEIYVEDYIYDKEAKIFCNEEFHKLDIKNNDLIINTQKDYRILLNTHNIDDSSYADNIIFGNNNDLNCDVVLTLKSDTHNKSYIKFLANEKDYQVGLSNSTFNILWDNREVFSISDCLDDKEYEYIIGDISNKIFIESSSQYIFNNGKIKGVNNINFKDNLHITDDSNKLHMAFINNDVNVYKRLHCYGGLTNTSDKRIKSNICAIENALDKIEKLNGVSYYNKITNGNEIGLIAQDVQEVIPDVVNDSGDLLGIQYGNIVALLIEGIKDLRRELNGMK